MITTRKTAEAIGERTGVDPLVLVALISAVVQVLSMCYADNDDPVENAQREAKENPSRTWRVIRRRARRAGVPREQLTAVTDEVMARIKNGPLLRAILAEHADEADTGEFPAVT